MQELDPVVIYAVFTEMLGAPLLWSMVLLAVAGTVLFISLLVRERGVVAARMVRSQLVGVLGGVLALIVMVKVSSSGFTDAGGPIDWFLIAVVFGLGLIGTTVISYGVAGWFRRAR